MVKDQFLYLVHSSHVPQPERPLGRHVVPARADARARGALRSPSPEAPRRRARRRVAARGRGHWCRRRGGCPARDVRPNEGLGGRGAVLGFTVASEAPRGIPRGYSSRAHNAQDGTPGNSPRLLLTSALDMRILVSPLCPRRRHRHHRRRRPRRHRSAARCGEALRGAMASSQ